ncbi:group II intron maturase-specific domain-containing protein [Mycoavidus sp. B2-EB]|uniref:group II intron maturase-specific domain-containing protein n=1 Tax=Mycoavidus sp. B2-EB TaxID=2651972 RepID=UPI00162654B5|nr:group II intron maturase-specific domain-containing protein [Mycoavidus sp. B2-EB]BBO59119.1 group II intron reverse transcriptase/maturase [Mycoavidus sp. B2-EB]
MSIQQAMCQMPVQTGRAGIARGEATCVLGSDEACCPRHESGNTGSALLEAALTRENLKQAFKRIRSNKGAAGVDGRDVDQTARHLATAWPVIREQLLKGTYRPSPVRRVSIPKPDGGERELGIPTVTDRLIQQRHQGTPQGGPLSPLLANVLLDEVDRELEKRGHCFARYADDANVYVRSRRAGERVMALLRRLYGRLHLKINETKSAVASVFGRKFLGYSLWVAPGRVVKRKVAAKPLQAFKHRIRALTRRSGGRSMKDVVERLRPYILGWKAYFRLAQTPGVWLKLDEWVRHWLRAIQLKQWRRGPTIYRELRALGASAETARQVAANNRCWWRNSDRAIKLVLTIAYSDQLGVPRLS